MAGGNVHEQRTAGVPESRWELRAQATVLEQPRIETVEKE